MRDSRLASDIEHACHRCTCGFKWFSGEGTVTEWLNRVMPHSPVRITFTPTEES
jgi:hypothetical protein